MSRTEDREILSELFSSETPQARKDEILGTIRGRIEAARLAREAAASERSSGGE